MVSLVSTHFSCGIARFSLSCFFALAAVHCHPFVGKKKYMALLAFCWDIRATSDRRLRAHAITFRALSLVEKAESVRVRFTLRSRDQRSM